jgi:hypothetical protein
VPVFVFLAMKAGEFDSRHTKVFLEEEMEKGPSLSVANTNRRGCRKQGFVTAILVLLTSLLYAAFCQAQIVGTAQLNFERRGHTATLLEDGKVLIVGGDNQNGMVGQAELLDPVSQTSSLAATSIVARTDHTATRLADARVLVIGGRGQNGSLTSTEIYDPMTATFTAGPSLTAPRSGHTSTVLSDGKILIAGGDVSGSAEIYDPATRSFSPIAANMIAARKFHSAILTSFGQVLIVGGVDAQNTVLNTAEVFDPSSQSFYLPPTDMQAPRALATLKLLTDGKVQIIGGDAELSMEVLDPVTGIFNAKALLPPNANLLGATLSTQSRAALFSPLVMQDPMLQGLLTPEQSALLDRADQSITELPSRNQALVAGGINSAGQILNSAKLVSSSSASITTDKNDYAPGQIVTITGSGFRPNEQVDIYFHEFPEEYTDIYLSAVANQQGNFVTAEFAPQEIDLGRVFTLTAIGQSSGFTAQTAFKDNKDLTITFAGTGSGTVNGSGISPSSPGVSSFSCTGNPCKPSLNNNATGTITATANAGSVFAGWSGSFVGSGTTTCTGTTSPCTFFMGTGGGSAQSLTATFNAVIATTLTVSVASGTYGGSTGSITATLTRTSGGTGVSGKTISFTLNGGSVGTATTNAGGIATLSGASLSGFNAGSYPTGVGASFAGDAGFSGSSGTNTLTINKKDATWTTNAASKTYGDLDPVPLTTGIGSGFLSADGVSATYSRTSGESASPPTYHITANLSATVAGALNNYNITNNGAEFTINKKDATWTTNPASKIYGDPDPVPLTTGSGTGFLASDNVTATYSRIAGETVAGSPYHITATLSPAGVLGNYNITNTGADFTINKKSASVTATDANKIYGDADPTLGTTNNGFIAADLGPTKITFSASRAAGENIGTYTITPSASDNGTGLLNNYTITYNNGTFTINKRPITITADAKSKVYGDADPALTYQITAGSLKSGDSITGALTRAPGENVGTYAITQGTLAVSDGNSGNNYNLTFVGANLTINKRPITITADAKTKIYGDSDPALTYQITSGSLKSGDSIVGSLTRAPGENVGTYAITQGTLGISDGNGGNNYDLTFIAALLTIDKRPASVTPNAANKIYGDPDPAFSGTLTGFIAADGVTAVYSRTPGETVAGNPYTISVVLSPAGVLGNYDITYNTASFTINVRPASVTPNAASKIYGNADPSLSGTLTGFIAADGVTAVYSRTAGETVAGSPYTISAVLSPAGVLGNYDITYNTANFTINLRPASVTPNAASKIYGNADPSFTGALTGFIAADTVTAIYSRTAGETVAGSPYTISAVLSPASVLSNYDITYNTANFTIYKRSITVTADAKSKIYGDPDPALTYQVTSGSLAFSDTFTGALSRVAGELVGTYAIQQGTLALNSNYTLTYIGANLTITTGFAFNGFYSPIGGSVENGNGGSFTDPVRTFKLNSTIPVKFGATWLNGGAPLITGIHTLQAVKYSNAVDSEQPIDATPTDAATTGNQFRLTDTDWHFNLSTKNSGFSVGTWLLIATLQDGSKHSVWISIKK